MKKIIILIACTCLYSCVLTNIPKNEKKAKKRLNKHLNNVRKIINVYPSLSDTTTIFVHDTITLKSHSVDTSFIHELDTNFIDKLLFDFLSEGDGTEVNEKIRVVRDNIIVEVLKDTTFTYSDSLMHFTFLIKEGRYYFKNTVKERNVSYVSETKNVIDTDCDVTKDFWKDYKFWLFLLIIVVLSIIYNKLQYKH